MHTHTQAHTGTQTAPRLSLSPLPHSPPDSTPAVSSQCTGRQSHTQTYTHTHTHTHTYIVSRRMLLCSQIALFQLQAQLQGLGLRECRAGDRDRASGPGV
eukprot:440194-Rhodomonas_salina.1